MEERKVRQKIDAISRKLTKSHLIDKCYAVAKKLGQGKTTVYNYYTNTKFDYRDSKIDIRVNDGLGDMGGGIIEVFHDNQLVLKCDRYADEKEFAPKASGFGIKEYHSGEWEKLINNLYRRKPEKEKSRPKKSAPAEVPKEQLEKLVKNYDLNF